MIYDESLSVMENFGPRPTVNMAGCASLTLHALPYLFQKLLLPFIQVN